MTILSGLDLSTLDRTVNPADDFYGFCNGKWLDEIPKDKSRWDFFTQVEDKVLEDLHTLVTELGESNCGDPMSESYKLGAIWKKAMDLDDINALATSPLDDLFAAIDSAKTKSDYIRAVALLHRNGIGLVFSAGSEADLKDSSVEIMWLGEGGLGLPNREYYFDVDKEEKRHKYVGHIEEMLKLAGVLPDQEAASAASVIMALETAIAEVSYSNVERRDIPRQYNPVEPKDLPDGWDWSEYFAEAGNGHFDLTQSKLLNIQNPKHLAYVINAVSAETLSDWKIYAKWHILRSMGWYLAEPFVDATFAFYKKELTGQEEKQARWKRMIRFLNSSAGELLGKVYCQRYFPESSKHKMQEMVKNLIESLREIVEEVDWMADKTRQAALNKLDNFGVKIGYPDKWIDYADLRLTDSDGFVAIVRKLSEFEHYRDWKKANKPIDRTKWAMPPQVVNAYYHPLLNELVFPAAILQAPAFDPDRDMCANYGGIGAVIGHEASHGFDDQGRQFDANGNMVDWWTEEDAKRYNEKKQLVIDQFNKIEVLDGQCVNGELTQGENTSDLAGLKIAYRALIKALQNRPECHGVIDGFTPEQRFFVSWGQFWRTKNRPDIEKMLLVTDVHAPGHTRAWVPLRNLPEFAAAFDVKAGDKMYLPCEERANVW